ncbi:hypothetical protein PHLCEN_2v1926 [Hermanssonia centrifuga]|uniref:Uncharacterized protein n=1 Tax=Hermanssonia centrifuga TaxID=98765 RepID=A0A2R6RVG1_9APHY|nr:hypothetical protein PHLCEN_2v1926 [Hermanssonia centrifuga]
MVEPFFISTEDKPFNTSIFYSDGAGVFSHRIYGSGNPISPYVKDLVSHFYPPNLFSVLREGKKMWTNQVFYTAWP